MGNSVCVCAAPALLPPYIQIHGQDDTAALGASSDGGSTFAKHVRISPLRLVLLRTNLVAVTQGIQKMLEKHIMYSQYLLQRY